MRSAARRRVAGVRWAWVSAVTEMLEWPSVRLTDAMSSPAFWRRRASVTMSGSVRVRRLRSVLGSGSVERVRVRVRTVNRALTAVQWRVHVSPPA